MRLEARQITDSVGVVTSKTTSNDLTFERGWSFPVLLTPLVGNRFYDSCIPSLRLLFFPIVLLPVLTSYHLPVDQALTKIFSTGTAANFCINCLFFPRSMSSGLERKSSYQNDTEANLKAQEFRPLMIYFVLLSRLLFVSKETIQLSFIQLSFLFIIEFYVSILLTRK